MASLTRPTLPQQTLLRRTLLRRIQPASSQSLAATALVCFTCFAVPTLLAQNTAPDAAPGQLTLHARVPLTYVDVVVTDANGRPIHGLQPADFTLLEDGRPMTPNSFEEHRSDTAPLPEPALARQSLPPDTFSNAASNPPGNRPLNILVIDSLNTPLSNQRILQQHMLDFVKKMAPGTRVAVFLLNEFHLSILQGFTSDRELLTAAIDSKKLSGQVPPVEDLWQDQMDPLQVSSDPDEEQCNHSALRAQDTLAAMRQIARFLSAMPGRKNLVWFSGSFQQQMQAHGGVCYDVTQDLKNADGDLARAHIVVYPIDPRAMDAMTEPIPHQAAVVRMQSVEHLTMEAIAEDTGGKAFYNNNALDQLAADAIATGSNFYTLTYTPIDQTLDTRFRAIAVKIDRPNLHLTYRNGYYAVDPVTDSRGKPIEKVTAMQSAMMRGALDSTQILFNVKVVESSATEATLPASNIPGAKQMKPPYRHFTIAYTIDTHGLEFNQTPDGNYRANFEYGVNVYNPDGNQILNSTSKVVNPVLPPSVFRSILATGTGAHQEIDVPATGEFFLRIGVHDLVSGRTGSIEFPVSSIAPAATSLGTTSALPQAAR